MKKRPWCKCDDWYEAVELEFILWDEERYYLKSKDMEKHITHCPFCGKKLERK